jgi:hypothetical protein
MFPYREDEPGEVMGGGELAGRLRHPFPAGSVLGEQSDPLQELPVTAGSDGFPSMKDPVTPSVTMSGSAPIGEHRITSPAAASSAAAAARR